jgi:hypothetical protein
MLHVLPTHCPTPNSCQASITGIHATPRYTHMRNRRAGASEHVPFFAPCWVWHCAARDLLDLKHKWREERSTAVNTCVILSGMKSKIACGALGTSSQSNGSGVFNSLQLMFISSSAQKNKCVMGDSGAGFGCVAGI